MHARTALRLPTATVNRADAHRQLHVDGSDTRHVSARRTVAGFRRLEHSVQRHDRVPLALTFDKRAMNACLIGIRWRRRLALLLGSRAPPRVAGRRDAPDGAFPPGSSTGRGERFPDSVVWDW